MIFNQKEREIIRINHPETIQESIIVIRYLLSNIFNDIIRMLKIREIINWLSKKLIKTP